MESGRLDSYARRADVTYCNIYFNPKVDNPQPHIDGLFVFCDQGSLEEFTQKFDDKVLPDRVPYGLFVLRQLLRQVVENGAEFLRTISREIHTAVRPVFISGVFYYVNDDLEIRRSPAPGKN
jgi:hypothetical protein